MWAHFMESSYHDRLVVKLHHDDNGENSIMNLQKQG